MIAFLRKKISHKERPFLGKKKLLVAALAVVVIGLAVFWSLTRYRVSTDDAFVDGHIHQVSPRISGFVTEVLVEDNQVVEAGQTLAVLDPTDYKVALAQAKADLASAKSTLVGQQLGVPLELNQTSSRVASAKAQLASLLKTLNQLRKEGEAARKVVAQNQADFEQARLDLERYDSLRAREVVAQADLDTARTRYRTTQAVVQQNQARSVALDHNLASTEAQVARLQAEIDLAVTGESQAVIMSKDAEAQAARVDLAQERLRQAELNLQYTKIHAPVAGQVTRKLVETGQYVAAGQPLLAVVPMAAKDLWITANFKESQLTDMRPGQEAVITVDTYPDLEIRGKVESIMAGTGSVFTLFPPENAAGNYVKVVQRIPVRIVFDPGTRDLPPLRLGMSVVPTVLTR